MANPSIYTVGGTVQAGSGVYIPRQADDQLLELCRSGTFAYVLTPRQMGKSSLMVRTAERLRQEGVCTAIADLQPIGAQVSPEAWYLGLLTEIEDQLDLDTDLLDWWEGHGHLGLAQRLTRFFSEVVLREIDGSIVVFIDEIDTTLSLDFTDDFFIALRYFYTDRARNPEFKRLSFVLIGVATPSDLIKDPRRTPFNIGQPVELTDFSSDEALPLAKGLDLRAKEAQHVLQQILEWTSGHPYLTQRLCQEASFRISNISRGKERGCFDSLDINGLVHEIFLGRKSWQDNNLQFVRDMLTKQASDPVNVLKMYRKIGQLRVPVYDDGQSLIKSHLKLSGIVYSENNYLKVRNLIYKKVFNAKWISENLPSQSLRPVFAVGVIMTVVVALIKGLGLLQNFELGAFDALMRARPSEQKDSRIVIVLIERNSDQFVTDDVKITKLLNKILEDSPAVIGLHAFIEPSNEENRENLVGLFEKHENLIGSKKILPPVERSPFSGVSSELSELQFGINDIPIDPDGRIRRVFLGAYANREDCLTGKAISFCFSFSFMIARKYLELKGYSLGNSPVNARSPIFIDQSTQEYTTIPILNPTSGGYARERAIAPEQVLLNFRSGKNAFDILSADEILHSKVDVRKLENKVVIIGSVNFLAPNFLETLAETDLNQSLDIPLPRLGVLGAELEAHAVSQLINAVLEERPLIQTLSIAQEFFWILTWSVVGGLTGRYFQKNYQFIAAVIIIMIAACLFCYIALAVWAVWFSLIPITLAMTVTSRIIFRINKVKRITGDLGHR